MNEIGLAPEEPVALRPRAPASEPEDERDDGRADAPTSSDVSSAARIAGVRRTPRRYQSSVNAGSATPATSLALNEYRTMIAIGT